MAKYLCNDGNAEVEIEADSAEDAAQEYVDGGEWGDIEATTWLRVYVKEVLGATPDGSHLPGCSEVHRGRICVTPHERHTITIDPEEPDCNAGEDHDWQSPHEIVGGIKGNPGVRGHGGGVVIQEVCMRCGTERVTDTWAQDPETGEQGLTSVEYHERKYEDVVEDNE